MLSSFVSSTVFANGTPIARSDVAATGNIIPVRQENIGLQQETLQVVVDGDWAAVRVEYQFLNSQGATTVPYGFPVDYQNPAWCNDCDDVSDAEKARAGESLRDIRIEVDGDLGSAWCEGVAGDGAGQSLTFDFKPGVFVEGVGILNGYARNQAIYLSNGRATKMTAAVSEEKSLSFSADLPARNFSELNPQALAPFIDWIVDASPYGPTRSITLTLDAAAPGAKHPDTCISEVYFIGGAASTPTDATE